MEEEGGFQLLLNLPPSGTFTDGATVGGTLVTRVRNPLTVQSIAVSLEGTSDVMWVETCNNSAVPRAQTLVHVSTSQELWSRPGPGTHQEPVPGEHWYQFQLSIPEGIPGSFEGEFGRTAYRVEAKMVSRAGSIKADSGCTSTMIGARCKHLSKSGVTVTKAEWKITVEQRVKVDKEHWMKPTRKKTQKNLCCLCCASGSIAMTMTLPRRGYCRGEQIPVLVLVDNASSRRVKVEVQLKKYTEYIVCTSPTSKSIKREVEIIGERASNEIPPHSSEGYECLLDLDPRLPPTTLTPSLPLCIMYVLQASLKVRWGKSITVETVPIIGSEMERANIRKVAHLLPR